MIQKSGNMAATIARVEPARAEPAPRPVPPGPSPSNRPPAPRPFWRRPRLWLLLALVVAGLAWWYRADSGTALVPMTAPAMPGNVEISVLATGILKPEKLVAVGAEASGRITALAVALGDVVRAGDLIAEIDSTRQENSLKTAEAALAAMEAQRVEKNATLADQERTLTRQKALVERNTIAQSDLDSAAADVEVTLAQITAIEAQLEAARVAVASARLDLGYTRVTAPIDGTILSVVAQEGQTVNATQSTPTIVVLGDLDTMSIHAEISEADVVRVEPGQKVWFTILGDPDTPHAAILSSISPAPDSIIDDQSLTGSVDSTTTSEAIYYNGIFSVPNPDGRLRTYMTAEVHVVLDQAENVLTIPSAALGATGADGARTVRVMGADGVVSPRQVEIGLDDKSTAEVLSGLTQGEKVVIGVASPAAASDGQRMGPPPMGL